MMMNLIRTSTSLIILILMFTSQSSAKFDPKTLVGAWLFDGNAKDASGNGKDGTLENGPKWTAGKFGQALEFNGGKKSSVVCRAFGGLGRGPLGRPPGAGSSFADCSQHPPQARSWVALWVAWLVTL